MSAVVAPAARPLRAVFYEKLHRTYRRHNFDNWQVWAGNESIEIDGTRYGPTLARAYIDPRGKVPGARVRVELFVAGIDRARVCPGDVDARLWTDAGRRGRADGQGGFQDDPGRYVPMRLVPGAPGPNLVFESEVFALEASGVFSYTVEFSADSHAEAGRKEWISLNDMARNKDGVIVVSPEWVRRAPSLCEVCLRKVGARLEGGAFCSGTIPDTTARLQEIHADVVYLLPFFRPGFADLHTGEDVRKGELGSVYAVRDFFQLDPELVFLPGQAEWQRLAAAGFLQRGEQQTTAALAGGSLKEAEERIGLQEVVQLVGRAQLRELVSRAHQLGKRVIFDLVLMQTSRDNPLIEAHPEWYVLDENGVPQIHRIAWLVYSDVALFDLVFNKSLQNYLLGIAPYWMEKCGLDGVRIDASQTVDRPFLKKLKNRIDALRPDALVLGETLCPLDEAVDVPVDMVYALLVDFHRDVERARPLIDFLEEMHARFAPGTVAMAYFENHDSPRATRVWREKFAALLAHSAQARALWQGAPCPAGEQPLLMALLKNLQASLIDLSAGSAGGSNLAFALELGSEWGEEVRTDFENATLLRWEERHGEPRASLVRAYARLHGLRAQCPEWVEGAVYYQRNEFPGGDPEDRVFACVRYTRDGALLAVHNFDPLARRQVRYGFEYLPWKVERVECLFDTCAELGMAVPGEAVARGEGGTFVFALQPLQSLIVRLRGAG